MSNFETNPKKLKEDLLNLIYIRDMALPDFQRDFVWQPRQTQELIVSLAKSFPAGSLLRIESTDHMFKPRAFAGAPVLDGHKPKYLVLDGQQRLTSLYQALYGTGDYLFFVDLKNLIETQDIESSIFYDRKDRAERRYGTIRDQAQKRVLPLCTLFGGEGFHAWLDEIEDSLNQDNQPDNLLNDEKKAIRLAYENYVSPVVNYEFPVVTLTGNVSLEAVCTIFETLNNTGVRLSVFDLLSARYFAEGYNLRDLWAQAVENSNHLEDFAIDPYYILQVICSRILNSVKRSDVLKLNASDVVASWDDAIWSIKQVLEILYHECGVLTPNWLSYNTILIPAASIFMKNKDLKGAAVGNLRSKFKRWYWCSVFGQSYESNPTSQSILDISQFQVWLEGGVAPLSVSNFKFDSKDLYFTTTKQRAVYRGLMCLILRTPSLDFHSTQPISAALIEENHIDDHHIFPKGYMQNNPPHGTSLSDYEIDSILNRTLIDKETNIRIGMNAPSVYLKEIRSHLQEQSGDASVLEKILSSHQLPIDPRSSLWSNDFLEFRKEREKALASLVENAVTNG
ncbi:MAG: DUF262 domain-containing protein [Anaerolineaceae bacterium]